MYNNAIVRKRSNVQRARESGAPVSSDQAPVRLDEGALSWLAEEHCASADAVRAIQPVDGTPAVDGDAGSSPCESGIGARIRAQTSLLETIAS